MNDKIKEYVRVWLNKAQSDMKNAQMIMSASDTSPPLDTVCFHGQQASKNISRHISSTITGLSPFHITWRTLSMSACRWIRILPRYKEKLKC